MKRSQAYLSYRKVQFDRLQALWQKRAIDERLLGEARHESDAADASVEGARAFVRESQAQIEVKKMQLVKMLSELAAANCKTR